MARKAKQAAVPAWKRKQRQAMRADLAKQADAIIARQHKRPAVPPMLADKKYAFVPPYRSAEDQDRWWALFFDALGTRQISVVEMFFRQIEALVDQSYNQDWQQWVADEEQMIAGFALIQSLKVRNVAEAALAAQLFALHLSNMKLARSATQYDRGDARTTATLARSIRAYGDGMLALQRLQGRGKTRRTKQTIIVEKRTTYVQQVNNYGGGGENGGQPHGTDAGGFAELRSLPSPDEGGELVPIPCGEGQAGVQDPRRAKSRRSQGTSERNVSAWRVDERGGEGEA